MSIFTCQGGFGTLLASGMALFSFDTPGPSTAEYPKTPDSYRSIREELGMTQEQLADMLETTPKTISRRETGFSAITRESWLAIMQIYNHSLAVSMGMPFTDPETGKLMRINPDGSVSEAVRPQS